MVTMQQIYDEYRKENIGLYFWNTPCEAVTIERNGKYDVFVDFLKRLSIAEQKWILAHEYGHCATGATHRLTSPFQLKEQHEYRANKKAALTFLPAHDFTEAFENGVTTSWDLAEWFDIPEEEVLNIWAYYKQNDLL